MSGRRKHAKRDFGCPLDGGVGAPLDNGTNAFIRVPVTFIDKSIDERKNQLWSSISSLGYWLSAIAISPAPTASNAFEDRLMLPAPYLSGRLDSLHVAKDFGFRDGEHDLRIGIESTDAFRFTARD